MAKKSVRARATVNVVTAAESLQVGTTTIHRLCEQGELEYYRPTSATKSPRRIYIDSIVAYAKKQGREITVESDRS